MVPELALDEVRFRVYRGGRLAALGQAAHATYRRDNSDVSAQEIQVDFEEARRGEVHLTAPAGRGNARSRELTAWGGVRLVQGDTVADTPEARYTSSDGLVHGDKPISIRGPSYRLDGAGFVLDPRTEKLDVVGGARGKAGERRAR